MIRQMRLINRPSRTGIYEKFSAGIDGMSDFLGSLKSIKKGALQLFLARRATNSVESGDTACRRHVRIVDLVPQETRRHSDMVMIQDVVEYTYTIRLAVRFPSGLPPTAHTRDVLTGAGVGTSYTTADNIVATVYQQLGYARPAVAVNVFRCSADDVHHLPPPILLAESRAAALPR